MKFSLNFLGWFGHIADDATFSRVIQIANGLELYYKKHNTPGQKLMIGYDTRYFSKIFAELIACYMADRGMKIFMSNKAVPSPVLNICLLHKKSMGAICITGDEYNASSIGIRAFDDQGHMLLNIPTEATAKSQTSLDSLKKHLNKGMIELFDPVIVYKKFLEDKIDFAGLAPSTQRILFNPLFGSGIYYFDRILNEKNIHGYTIDRELTSDLGDIEPSPFLNRNNLIKDMQLHSTEIALSLSPDCTTFQFAYQDQLLETPEMLFFLSEHLKGKNNANPILISVNACLSKTICDRLELPYQIIETQEFYAALKTTDYSIALDGQGRFYFSNHGFPDALLTGYYLMEFFQKKNISNAQFSSVVNSLKGLV
jgi:phosphomannomutase